MALNDIRISVDDNTVTITFTGYGITTFTVEALEAGLLRMKESYKPKPGKDATEETSIAVAAVDRHTIDVYNL